MSTAVTGGDFVLYFDNGTNGQEDWVMIAGQRNASLSQSTESHEVSVKGSGSWKGYILGFREWSISCDGLYMLDDDSYKKFSQAYSDRKKLKIEMRIPNGKYEGQVVIENFDLSMGYNEAVSYSCTLLGDGELKLVDDMEDNKTV